MPLCAEATVIAKLNNANQAPTMPSPLRNHVPLPQQLADAIPEGYLDGQSQMIDTVNLQEVHNSFMASSTHLFSFVMNYRYRKEVTRGEKLIFFCQLASQYADELRFTDTYEISDEVEYPLIYAK